MSDMSLSAITRIVKSIDPNIRIGVKTKLELRASLEDYASCLAELAISSARNANRTTVLTQDIISAREQLMIGIAYHQTQISS